MRHLISRRPKRRGLIATCVWTLLLVSTCAPLATAVQPEDAEHLIVCPAVLAPIFQSLANHRTQEGIPSAVVALEDVLVSATGRDDAETLRNHLVQLHTLGRLRYVLLGGDAGVVPVRMAHSMFYPSGGATDLASDLYFAAMDGDWDGDGDSIFAEPFVSSADPGDGADLAPELAVGRAPVSTVAQAQRFVDGVLGYDNATHSPHFGSALLMAEVLFPADWAGGSIQLDGATYAEDVRASLLTHPTPAMSLRLYENSGAYPGSNPLNLANTLAALNSGNHGTIFYVGGGDLQSFALGAETLGIADIDALTNAPFYNITLALSNRAAEFTANCILEHLVTAPNGGSAATVGFTNIVFQTTASRYSEAFYSSLAATSAVRVGDAVRSTLLLHAGDTFFDTPSRWTSLSLVLFGDPAMPFRSESEPVPTRRASFGGLKRRYR